MPVSDHDHIGARIAAHRKRAGLTQQGLAQLIPYSYSLLRHVEAGHRAASPQLLTAVARALRVDVSALAGPPMGPVQSARITALLRPVREALDLHDLPLDPGVTPRPADQLTTEADAMCRLVRAAHLQQAAAALPGLLAELTVACRETPTSHTWAALASACRSAHDIATKLGRYDLAALALDRMGLAADRASDPVLGALRQYKRALAYRSPESQHRIGLAMAAEGRRMIEQADDSTVARAVQGQLHLGAAVIAARADLPAEAEQHLARAGAIAARTGEVGRIYWLSFGPTNVATHAVYAWLALRRFEEAYTAARAVRMPSGWATSRRAGYLVDRSVAEMETGRTEAALKSLSAARQLAPQQTRVHPRVRETVRALLHMCRQAPDPLTRMASWVGV
ncbi:helix-turn-helix domain-containing protein [Streptomyces sp. JJ38]|uniref:helix-turn-helix domain-containing protein n=1 Tax=Streptomyces sp. JJ38 TaxID=2738128 RepID=UPI001C58ABD5|nr:helix-turn-helix transcriptional regulator [Streptomyces sp. JJ38]MBW1598993.1 helix-turn-helix domain-containing protein [Streptomyces sp. JJ38]